MGFNALIRLLLGTVTGVLAFSTSTLAMPLVDSDIENYAGLGVRAGLNDPAALVVDSKLKLVSIDQGSLSVRPAIFIGEDFEGRLPVSFDLPLDEQFVFFGGGGFAYSFDDSDFDPMVTGGLDMAISERLILNIEGNLIIKSNDTDAEVSTSINWLF